jgi:capsular exopolysaccharide synthesis family protein
VVEAAFAEAGVSASYEDAVSTLDVAPLRGPQIIELSVRSSDPNTAARLANQLVVAAVEQARTTQSNQLAARRAQLAESANQLAAEVATRIQHLDQLRTQAAEVPSEAEVAATQAALADAELRYAAAQRSVAEQDLAATRSGDPLSTIEPALPPAMPSFPRPAVTVAVGAALGAVVGLLVAAVLELLGDRLSTPAGVRRRTGLPVWSVVPDAQAAATAAGASEAFRTLRTALQRAVGQRPTTVLVTTSRPGQGSTATAVGLATAWAHAGERVVLLDANVQTPALARLLGVQSVPDVGALLEAEPTPDLLGTALRPTAIDGLQVLTCGSNREGSRDLLASRRMARLIDQVRTVSDRVVIDAPPVSATETLAVAQCADAVLLVVHGRRSRGRDVQRSASALRAATAAVLGTVLNHALAPTPTSALPTPAVPAGSTGREPGVV